MRKVTTGLTAEEARARFDNIAEGQIIENQDRSQQYVFNIKRRKQYGKAYE